MVVSDCVNLIAKVNEKSQNRSYTGAVVFDIKQMATRFPSICFSYRSRACNRAVHSLACAAEHVAYAVWVNEVPEVVRNIICNELISVDK
jgi:hypothetical protein